MNTQKHALVIGAHKPEDPIENRREYYNPMADAADARRWNSFFNNLGAEWTWEGMPEIIPNGLICLGNIQLGDASLMEELMRAYNNEYHRVFDEAYIQKQASFDMIIIDRVTTWCLDIHDPRFDGHHRITSWYDSDWDKGYKIKSHILCLLYYHLLCLLKPGGNLIVENFSLSPGHMQLLRRCFEETSRWDFNAPNNRCLNYEKGYMCQISLDDFTEFKRRKSKIISIEEVKQHLMNMFLIINHHRELGAIYQTNDQHKWQKIAHSKRWHIINPDVSTVQTSPQPNILVIGAYKSAYTDPSTEEIKTTDSDSARWDTFCQQHNMIWTSLPDIVPTNIKITVKNDKETSVSMLGRLIDEYNNTYDNVFKKGEISKEIFDYIIFDRGITEYLTVKYPLELSAAYQETCNNPRFVSIETHFQKHIMCLLFYNLLCLLKINGSLIIDTFYLEQGHVQLLGECFTQIKNWNYNDPTNQTLRYNVIYEKNSLHQFKEFKQKLPLYKMLSPEDIKQQLLTLLLSSEEKQDNLCDGNIINQCPLLKDSPKQNTTTSFFVAAKEQTLLHTQTSSSSLPIIREQQQHEKPSLQTPMMEPLLNHEDRTEEPTTEKSYCCCFF